MLFRSDDGKHFEVPFENLSKAHASYLDGTKNVILGVRPEHLSVSEKETGIQAKVNLIEQLGNESIVYGQLSLDSEIDLKAKNQVTIKIPSGVNYELGQVINVSVDIDKIHLFDKESELTILEEIPQYNVIDATATKGKLELLGSKVTLPEVYAKAIAENKEITVHVPPHACVDSGKDYTLKVHNVELIGKTKLVALEYGDRYIFLNTKKDVKAGEDFTFSLRNEMIRVLVNGETVLEPVAEKEALLGSFVKQKEAVKFVKDGKELIEATGDEPENAKLVKKQRVKFYYEVNGVKFLSPMEKVVKITTIEGPSCYRKEYKYVLDRHNIHLCEEGRGLHATVEEIVNYGNVRYARLNANGQKLLIEVNKSFNSSEVNICFNGNDVEVYQIQIDMRIC